jgi:hypothetical protein
LIVFRSSPWFESTNWAMHSKSTTATPILISVAVIPRNDALSGTLEDDDAEEPDTVAAVFLLLLQADKIKTAASSRATADRIRTMVPPTRVVCSAVAENFFDTTHWRRGLH